MNATISLHQRPIGTTVGITEDGIARFDGNRDVAAVLVLTGDIDEAALATLRTTLDDVIASTSRRLIVDLTSVEFLSVAATVELSEAQKRIGAERAVVLVGGPHCARRALVATQLDQVFDVAPSLRAALAGDLGLDFTPTAV